MAKRPRSRKSGLPKSNETNDHIRDPPQKSKRLTVGMSIHTGPGPQSEHQLCWSLFCWCFVKFSVLLPPKVNQIVQFSQPRTVCLSLVFKICPRLGFQSAPRWSSWFPVPRGRLQPALFGLLPGPAETQATAGRPQPQTGWCQEWLVNPSDMHTYHLSQQPNNP